MDVFCVFSFETSTPFFTVVSLPIIKMPFLLFFSCVVYTSCSVASTPLTGGSRMLSGKKVGEVELGGGVQLTKSSVDKDKSTKHLHCI